MSTICQSDYRPSEWVSKDFVTGIIGINVLLILLCLLITARGYVAERTGLRLCCGIRLLAVCSLVTNLLSLKFNSSICEDRFNVTTFSSQWPMFVITQLALLTIVFGLETGFNLTKFQLVLIGLHAFFLILSIPFYPSAPLWLAILLPSACSSYFLYLIIHINSLQYVTVPSKSITTCEPSNKPSSIFSEADVLFKRHLTNWISFGIMRYPLFYVLAATQSTSQDLTLVCQVLFNLMDVAVIVFSLVDSIIISFHSLTATLQQEYQSTEARRGYLRYVFHDVRVPLNSIMMGLDVLSSSMAVSIMSPKSSALICNENSTIINMMQEASTFMMDTLNDVLSMETIEAGALKLSFNEFEIRELVERVILSLQGSAEQKRIKLVPCVANIIPISVIGDRFRIEHVLANLLSNSIKFSPLETTITVDVKEANASSYQDNNSVWMNTKIKSFRDLINISPASSSRQQPLSYQMTSARMNHQLRRSQVNESEKEVAPKTCRITFSVIDEGPGMSEEDQKKLFVAFSQTAHKEPQTVQGTGLGLTLCKHTVELHGGSIECQSKLDEGTTFAFTIPFELPAVRPLDTYQSVGEEPADEECNYFDGNMSLDPILLAVNNSDSKKSNVSHNKLENQSVYSNTSSHCKLMSNDNRIPVLQLPSFSKSYSWQDIVPFGLATARSHDENVDNARANYITVDENSPTTRDIEKGGDSNKSITGRFVCRMDTGRSNGNSSTIYHTSTWSSQDNNSSFPYPSPINAPTIRVSPDNSPSRRFGTSSIDNGLIIISSRSNSNNNTMTPRNKSFSQTARSYIFSTSENRRGGGIGSSLNQSPTARSDSGCYEYNNSVIGDTIGRVAGNDIPGSNSGRIKTQSFSSTGSYNGSPGGGGGKISSSSNAVSNMSSRAFIHTVQGLVVDDSRANRAIESAFLGKRNVKCDVAENGEEAIQYFERHVQTSHVDVTADSDKLDSDVDNVSAVNSSANTGRNYYGVIFMDRNMPVKNGLQAAEELRQKGYINLIVGLTGSAFEDEVEEFLAHGADVVFSKPFTTTCMHALIEHVENYGFQSYPDVKYVLSNEILVPRSNGNGSTSKSGSSGSNNDSPCGSRTLLLPSASSIGTPRKLQPKRSHSVSQSLLHKQQVVDQSSNQTGSDKTVAIVELTHVTVAVSSARSNYSNIINSVHDTVVQSESKDTSDSFKTDAETITATATIFSPRISMPRPLSLSLPQLLNEFSPTNIEDKHFPVISMMMATSKTQNIHQDSHDDHHISSTSTQLIESVDDELSVVSNLSEVVQLSKDLLIDEFGMLLDHIHDDNLADDSSHQFAVHRALKSSHHDLSLFYSDTISPDSRRSSSSSVSNDIVDDRGSGNINKCSKSFDCVNDNAIGVQAVTVGDVITDAILNKKSDINEGIIQEASISHSGYSNTLTLSHQSTTDACLVYDNAANKTSQPEETLDVSRNSLFMDARDIPGRTLTIENSSSFVLVNTGDESKAVNGDVVESSLQNKKYFRLGSWYDFDFGDDKNANNNI